jgi:type II secretory pathway pseudopilin PulG
MLARRVGRCTYRVFTKRLTAFTLVELLVVIGIIAVLIGILVPTLNKARESARQVQCLSNMRQLALALISFTTEHGGWMPAVGSPNPSGYSSTGRPGVGSSVTNPSDWIAWRRVIDPVTGQNNGAGTPDQNITYSALAKYLGAKYVTHNTPAEANGVNLSLESIYRCPSDNLQQRLNSNNYRYSYSMNEYFSNPIDYQVPPIPSNRAQRAGFVFTGKYSSIKRTSDIISFICEDEQTIDDGRFRANPAQWTTAKVNGVAGRHRIRKAWAQLPNTQQANARNEDVLGNVAFMDGHAGILGRKDALRQKHTGSANADPPEIK